MSMRVYGEGPGAQLLVMTRLFPEPGPCPSPWAVSLFLGISGYGGGGDMMGLGTEGKDM